MLIQYGSDFSLIGKLMGKTRAQIKRKFKLIEKNHP